MQVYASGPAVTKFIRCGVQPQYEFLLDDANASIQMAEELAVRCQSAAVVITDVGHAAALPRGHRVGLGYYPL